MVRSPISANNFVSASFFMAVSANFLKTSFSMVRPVRRAFSHILLMIFVAIFSTVPVPMSVASYFPISFPHSGALDLKSLISC